jgi:hypothetical protein
MLGRDVGTLEGNAEGLAVGAREGFILGRDVGTLEGITVGD